MKQKNNVVKKSTIKEILKLIKPHMFFVVLSFLLAILTVTLTLYIPVLTGDAIDYIVEPGKVDFAKLLPLLQKMMIMILVTALAQWLMNLCNNHITYNVVKEIRIRAFNHLQELPLKYIDANQHGDILSRIVSDVDQFSDGLLMGFTQLFSGILTIVGTLLFMLSKNIPLACVVVLLTPISLFVASFIAKRTFSMFHKQSETRGRLTSLTNEMVGNEKIIQAFGYEKRAQERFDNINKELQDCSVKAIFFSSITNPATRFVNSLVYTAVAIVGALLAIKGHLSIGQLSCFLTYANQYTKPFNEISGVVTELQNSFACAERVFELISEQPQTPDAPDAHVLVDAKGTVDLEHVAFSYTPEQKLITDLNLHVNPGQRIAIVGPTGCGKSTLINLLMRFYDVKSGTIRVDHIPITEMTRDSLRTNYGMVLQETWLKSGTIRENICYGKTDATEEEIIAAAKAAHAHSFIKRMPDGYDTIISEDGGNLSQGQKQLLCISRVMLTLPPMLILDEATSSIDTRTEIRIQKAFEEMMKGRTSFIVAHRLSTIKEANVILVMKDGDIIEQGSHEELLAKNGFYANLYNSQFAPTA